MDDGDIVCNIVTLKKLAADDAEKARRNTDKKCSPVYKIIELFLMIQRIVGNRH